MRGLQKIFFALIAFEVCFASILPSPSTTDSSQDIPPNDVKRQALLGKPCVSDFIEKSKYLIENCARIEPQNNFTELLNVRVMSEEYTSLYQDIYGPDLYNDSKLIKVCNALNVNMPKFIIKGPSIDIFSLDQVCDIVHFAKTAPRGQENIDPIDTFRQGCRTLTSAQKIATVPNNNAKLTTVQLEGFYTAGGQNCSFTGCRDYAIARQKCEFLNETVTPEDQAEQLGISVELYEKLVFVRKLYTDRTDSGRLAQAKRSCEAINGIKGDGVNLALDEHVLKLSTEDLNQFTDLWINYKIAPNAEKIAATGDICAFINGVNFEK